jgi:hypothetical protein
MSGAPVCAVIEGVEVEFRATTLFGVLHLGEATMAGYRLYAYGHDGHMVEHDELEQPDDRTAIAASESRFPSTPLVELWQGVRLVVTFDRSRLASSGD